MHRAIAFAILFTVLPATAWAACSRSDLAGRYTLSAETRADLGTFWTTCDLVIAADGSVESGTACVQRDAAGASAQATVDGGKIRLWRSCRVTGRIVIAGYKSVVTKARMSRDKQTVSGKGRNPDDRSTIKFSAERL